jgi:hypothetical protein
MYTTHILQITMATILFTRLANVMSSTAKAAALLLLVAFTGSATTAKAGGGWCERWWCGGVVMVGANADVVLAPKLVVLVRTLVVWWCWCENWCGVGAKTGGVGYPLLRAFRPRLCRPFLFVLARDRSQSHRHTRYHEDDAAQIGSAANKRV